MLVLWGQVGRSVSGHRFCPTFLAVALDAAHFSEDALLQPDYYHNFMTIRSSFCSGHCGGACRGGLSSGCYSTFVGLLLG